MTEPVRLLKPLESWPFSLTYIKATGEPRWTSVAAEGLPRIPRHPKATHANSTLATDGTYLIALFGSEGLYGYDLATVTTDLRLAGFAVAGDRRDVDKALDKLRLHP